MKPLSKGTLLMIMAVMCAQAHPEASWTLPPSRFAEAEWQTNTPTWARTRLERPGTVVWFFVEMTEDEALPVLLRTLDHGETWLQAKAADELRKLTIPLPEELEGKAIAFYQSIDLSKLSTGKEKTLPGDSDRIELKVALALLVWKMNSEEGTAMLTELSEHAPQENVRQVATLVLAELKSESEKKPASNNPVESISPPAAGGEKPHP